MGLGLRLRSPTSNEVTQEAVSSTAKQVWESVLQTNLFLPTLMMRALASRAEGCREYGPIPASGVGTRAFPNLALIIHLDRWLVWNGR